MLAIIADCYTPLLALFSLLYLKSRFDWKKQLAAKGMLSIIFPFVIAYTYVTLFAFIEAYFGWWSVMGGNFSSHTAIVMILVFVLLRLDVIVGIISLISVLAYGYLMTVLNYHSWFDILTTMVACLPCWWMFVSFSLERKHDKHF